MRIGMRVAAVAAVALMACDSSSDEPTADASTADAAGCLQETTVDISGRFTERYSAEEHVPPAIPECTDTDTTRTVTIADPVPNSDGSVSYRFSHTGSFAGDGDLCGLVFRWAAESPSREQTGMLTFGDAGDTYARVSSFALKDQNGGGGSRGNGSRVGTPPPPELTAECP